MKLMLYSIDMTLLWVMIRSLDLSVVVVVVAVTL
jgi:hypothetical protein